MISLIIITYLGKFIPNLSEIDGPLREIIKKDHEYHWDNRRRRASKNRKIFAPSLQPSHITTYERRSRSNVMQAATQSEAYFCKKVVQSAYTSRVMTNTEANYAQIEMEMLAILHSCKKLHHIW